MICAGFLTDQERKDLRSILRQVRREALALRRANILLLLDKGWDFVRVADALFLEPGTIEAVYKAYRLDGRDSLYAAVISGRPLKLSVEQCKILAAHLEEAHYATSCEINDYIKAQFKVSYSRAGMIALLKQLGFVHQSTKILSPVAPLEQQQQAIAAYGELKANLPADQVIVHMDGVHPTHMARVGKVWMKRGEKLHVSGNSGRGRINIHGALNVATGQFTFMNNLTVDATSTIQLLEKLLVVYVDKSKIHVFLDNARYHFSKQVQAWLQAQGSRISLHFLPTYCPHLNPIERLWHILHQRVTRNRYYKTYNSFADAILTFCRKTIKDDWAKIKSYVTDNMSLKSNQNLKFI